MWYRNGADAHVDISGEAGMQARKDRLREARLEADRLAEERAKQEAETVKIERKP